MLSHTAQRKIAANERARRPHIAALPAALTHYEPTERTLGTFRELVYDAQIDYAGLTWHRVQHGFGGKAEREDFVADVPGVSVSVTNNLGRGFSEGRKGWGWDGDLYFSEAADTAIARAFDHALYKQAEAAARVHALTDGILRLKGALGR